MISGPYPGIWSSGNHGNHLWRPARKTISLSLKLSEVPGYIYRSSEGNCLVFKESPDASCASLVSPLEVKGVRCSRWVCGQPNDSPMREMVQERGRSHHQ